VDSHQQRSRTLSIDVANGTDTPTVLERTVYDSEYGPMISMAAVTNGLLSAWSSGTSAYTFRDANLDLSFLDTWIALANATNLDEFKQVFQNCGSTMWTNATYADKDGNAFYIDSSSVPNLSPETLSAIDEKLSDNLYANLFYNGLVVLDGDTSRDDWVEGPCRGRVPYERMPKLDRRDYVQNSNSSYWSTNTDELLTGFSPLFGGEEFRLNERTRLGLSMLQNPSDTGFGERSPAGDDGKFNAQELLQVIWNNRAFYAEDYLPDARARCELIGDTLVEPRLGAPGSVAEGCAVLANWSGNYNVDAIGAHLFRVTLGQLFTRNDISSAVGFDPSDPVNTPSGLPTQARGTSTDPFLQSLLAPGGEPVPLADTLPWHGGLGGLDGAFNAIGVVNSLVQENTLLPRQSPPTLRNTGGLAEQPGIGWRIGRGAGWHFGLQFNDDGPEAWGLVTYGQSTNPNLPWFTEQAMGYSSKTPRPLLFKEADIAPNVLPDQDLELELEF